MTKITNRETVVKGFYLDSENDFEKVAFEVVTSYTRSADKAREYAAKELDIAAQFVVVTDFENEAAKPFKWDVPSIMDTFRTIVREEDAKQLRDEMGNSTIVKYSVFDYAANVFGYKDGKPIAELVTLFDEAYKATKGDARTMVRNYAIDREMFDSVVFVDKCDIQEYEHFAVIPNDEVEAYKRYIEK